MGSKGSEESAVRFLPEKRSLTSLRAAAENCQGCHLYRHATQTVFGQGSPKARIVLVGEQPGDREDREGLPFVGPAGKLLDDALAEAGIARPEVYITNVVKHFKFVERGKRRVHQKPTSREVAACRPWLEAELATINPDAMVCLGATAAQAVFGASFRITKSRGEVIETNWCKKTLATWHPSAILRMPDPSRRQEMQDQLIRDLRTAL